VIGAEVERTGKVAQHERDPIRDLARDVANQSFALFDLRREAGSSFAQETPVEEKRGVAH
jgi:hypothetical protein